MPRLWLLGPDGTGTAVTIVDGNAVPPFDGLRKFAYAPGVTSDGTAWRTVHLEPGSKGGYAFAGGEDLNDDGWDDLLVGRPAADMLLDATPSDQAFLLAGFSAAYAPFHGGALVPSLSPSILLLLFTDNFGKLLLPGIPGGSGTAGIVHAYAQFIIVNQFGQVSLSNAVDMEFLP
ncbi:MAG: hypothetical protein FJ296_11050 [Planctomycetes bacterium]|nr:hypothetical protein [Planctomycetota bacterium]